MAEFLLYAGAIALRSNATRPVDRTGKFAICKLLMFLAIACLSSTFGPPPPNGGHPPRSLR
jgi:hypothetical protein